MVATKRLEQITCFMDTLDLLGDADFLFKYNIPVHKLSIIPDIMRADLTEHYGYSIIDSQF